LAAAEKRGDVFRAAPILCFRGRVKALGGDLEGALTDLQGGLDLILAHQVDTALPYALSFLAEALLERGDTDAAAAVLAKSGLLEDVPVSVHLFFFQLARGRLRLESGALERGGAGVLVLGQ